MIIYNDKLIHALVRHIEFGGMKVTGEPLHNLAEHMFNNVSKGLDSYRGKKVPLLVLQVLQHIECFITGKATKSKRAMWFSYGAVPAD